LSIVSFRDLFMRNVLLVLLFCAPLFCVPLNAYAYIGPGLGVGAIGVVCGALLSIVLALLAILWYPFKRLLKKKPKLDTGDFQDDSSPP